MKRSPTTKDVALLRQLHEAGQLLLSPEFQRNSVWPRAAKAYLIDTILNDKPIPLLFLQRARSPQSGKLTYHVIDGQQRLRAIFDFIDDRFRLSQTKGRFKNKFFSELPGSAQEAIQNYDLMVDELSGYSQKDIRDIFARMNRYVVKLVPQELRHAQSPGAFAEFVESLAQLDFWKSKRIFTPKQRARMRHAEFCAEITILLIEGPQDKKSSVDLYYQSASSKFKYAKQTKTTLLSYLDWIKKNIPQLESTFLRKPVDLYALLGALHNFTERRSRLPKVNRRRLRERIELFEKQLRQTPPVGEAARYAEAASRQTDNLRPRKTRIEILEKLILDRL